MSRRSRAAFEDDPTDSGDGQGYSGIFRERQPFSQEEKRDDGREDGPRRHDQDGLARSYFQKRLEEEAVAESQSNEAGEPEPEPWPEAGVDRKRRTRKEPVRDRQKDNAKNKAYAVYHERADAASRESEENGGEGPQEGGSKGYRLSEVRGIGNSFSPYE